MTYLLVARHSVASHFLFSGIIDTVGVNFRFFEASYSVFAGNFFWASGCYLSMLPVIGHRSNKYYAENWVLSSSTARIYCLHNQPKGYKEPVTTLFEPEYPPELYERDNVIGASITLHPLKFIG
jgi:hypothetical protein